MLTQYLRHLFENWFNFPNNKIFCQVSTVNNGLPHIRTMELYDFKDDGSLIFFTKVNSRKWQHLKKQPNIAACLLSLNIGQITVEGSALLQTSTNDLAMSTLYWENFLPEYWQNFYVSHSPQELHSAEVIPSSFGIIQIIPHMWEILEINSENFLKGSRKQFTKNHHLWNMTELQLE